jgi:membrane protein YqaA with SNARE-associated domain
MTDEPKLTATDVAVLVGKTVLALVALGAGVALAARYFRADLAALATFMSERLGLPGLVAGSFIADGFNFPVPVQAYLMAIVANDRAPVVPLIAMAIGSVLGSHAGFFVMIRVSRWPVVASWLARFARRGGAFLERYGYRALLIGAFLPVPYPLLVWVAGLRRITYGRFAWLVALRVPKLIMYYAMIRAGWRL